MVKPLLIFVFATLLAAACKSRNEALLEQYLFFPDITALHVHDSLKYLLPVLDTVLYRDQKYRYEAHLKTEEEKQKRRKEFFKRKKEVNEMDQKNLQIVKEIIKKHGWLGPRDLGFKASQTVFIVFQHADLQTQEAYLPILEKAFKEGKITPSNFAMYVDRIHIRNNKPQMYGTQVMRQNNVGEVYPLLNVDSVDAWRKSMGLDSLKNYVRQWKVSWDPEAYKKRLRSLKKKYRVVDSL